MSTYNVATDATFIAASAKDAVPNTLTNGGYAGESGVHYAGSDAGIRFRAAITDVVTRIYVGLSDAPELYRNGVRIATATLSGSGWTDLTLATGLSSAAAEYEIRPGLNQTLNSMYLSDVTLTGGTGLVAAAHTALPMVSWYGDSIVNLTTTLTDSSLGDPDITARANGYAAYRVGVPSQNVSTYLRDNTALITGTTPKPGAVIVCGGTNDRIHTVSLATFQADYQTMLGNLSTGLTAGTTIYCRAILPADGDLSGVASYNAKVAAAVTAHNGTSPACPAVYIPTLNWIDPTSGVDTADGLHPNASGYAKIGNRQKPIVASIAGSAFTTSGTTGTVTVTLAGGATFTGDQKITLAASAGNITATAASGTITNNGTGTVDVTPAAGATNFTYTADANATITYTNDQAGWTNPATTSYIGAPTAPGAPTLTSDDVEPAESGIQVAPQAPASNGGSAIIGYRIYANRNSGGARLVGTIAAANLLGGFLYTGSVSGDTVAIYVTCYNDVGESAASSTQTVTSQGPPPSTGQNRLSIGIGIGL